MGELVAIDSVPIATLQLLYSLDAIFLSNRDTRTTPFSNDSIGITTISSNHTDRVLTFGIITSSIGRFFDTAGIIHVRGTTRLGVLTGRFDARAAVRGIATKGLGIADSIQANRIGTARQRTCFEAMVGRIGAEIEEKKKKK